jgi:hypothetical protein
VELLEEYQCRRVKMSTPYRIDMIEASRTIGSREASFVLGKLADYFHWEHLIDSQVTRCPEIEGGARGPERIVG